MKEPLWPSSLNVIDESALGDDDEEEDDNVDEDGDEEVEEEEEEEEVEGGGGEEKSFSIPLPLFLSFHRSFCELLPQNSS